MKKFNSHITSLALATTFAIVISCSEQDEVPFVKNGSTNPSSTNPFTKVSKSARVGGELFNSAVGDPLDLATARNWKANYREKSPGETEGHFFGSEIIQQILGETGCVGIRIYYALDETGEKKLLIVGVDGEGNDLLPSGSEMMDGGEENTIADFSYPCPDYCPDEEI